MRVLVRKQCKTPQSVTVRIASTGQLAAYSCNYTRIYNCLSAQIRIALHRSLCDTSSNLTINIRLSFWFQAKHQGSSGSCHRGPNLHRYSYVYLTDHSTTAARAMCWDVMWWCIRINCAGKTQKFLGKTLTLLEQSLPSPLRQSHASFHNTGKFIICQLTQISSALTPVHSKHCFYELWVVSTCHAMITRHVSAQM